MLPIRPFLLPAIALLAACTTTPEPPRAAKQCDATAVQAQVGHLADEATIEVARDAAHAKTVRVIRPGQAVTMDFRDDRLNLYLDEQGKVSRASCG